jgi:hypothetical protein
MPVVGLMALGESETVSSKGIVSAFLQGLKDAGYAGRRRQLRL